MKIFIILLVIQLYIPTAFSGNLSTLIKASGSGSSSCAPGGTSYSVGGAPAFCMLSVTDGGLNVNTSINTGKECGQGKICMGGNCVTQSTPCNSGTANPAVNCGLGTFYVGSIGEYHYMRMPINCPATTMNPVCNLTYPGPSIQFSNSALVGSGARGLTLATSLSDGAANTLHLVSNYPDAAAAHFCNDLVYGGYSDWFLPSIDEVTLLNSHTRAHGLRQTNLNAWDQFSNYSYSVLASSTQASETNYFRREAPSTTYQADTSEGAYATTSAGKNVGGLTICMRKYKVQ